MLGRKTGCFVCFLRITMRRPLEENLGRLELPLDILSCELASVNMRGVTQPTWLSG